MGKTWEEEFKNQASKEDLMADLHTGTFCRNASPHGVVKENFVKVQVNTGFESHVSSDNSISIEPIFDALSGLYSIKPNLVTSVNGKSPFGLCPTSHNWSVGCSSRKNISGSSLGKKITRSSPSRGLGLLLETMATSLKKDISKDGEPFVIDFLEWGEVKAFLEVCEGFGAAV
ncbi:hypothetical protein V6N13_074709 [Hibiscus sabdariffa]